MSTSKSSHSLIEKTIYQIKTVYPSHFVFSALSSPPFDKLLTYQDTTNTFNSHAQLQHPHGRQTSLWISKGSSEAQKKKKMEVQGIK